MYICWSLVKYLIIPCLGLVVDDDGAKAPRWVDAGVSDRNGGQVHHEQRETDRQRSQYLHNTIIYRSNVSDMH